jgi:hypothetical protein
LPPRASALARHAKALFNLTAIFAKNSSPLKGYKELQQYRTEGRYGFVPRTGTVGNVALMTFGGLTMMTVSVAQKPGFPSALMAPGRSPEIPESADAYGLLIGSWELDVCDYGIDGAARASKGEVHFGWVLEGRAVQDVWIMPPRSERTVQLDKTGNRYGTTLRVWDPSIQAWRVTWINPVTGRRDELIGRRSGNDVVQLGTRGDGTPIRWIFTAITPESFHWLGEALKPDGKSWDLEAEFHARRMA